MAFSQDFPDCPPESFKTEVISPIDSSKSILCSKSTSEGYVLHGPKWKYDETGKLISKNFYDHGELSSNPSKKTRSQEALDLKEKTEKKDDHKVSLKNDYSFVRTILHEILQLWHPVKRPGRGRLALGGFETRGCGVNDLPLIRFIHEESEEFELELGFSGRCSLKGTHQLVWDRPVRIEWKLRDMRDYESLSMLVKLDKKLIKEKNRYQIKTQIRDAILRTKTGGLKFQADYQMSFDIEKRKALKGHGGELKIEEFDALKIEQDYPLSLKVYEMPSN